MTRAAIIALTRAHGPMTAKQLSIELGLQDNSVNISIRRARAHGTKYLIIADWRGAIPMYGPGPGDDVEGGGVERRVLSWLEDSGRRATVAEMAAALGMTTTAVDAAVRRIRTRERDLVPSRRSMHVVDWRRHIGSGGRESAIYMHGPGGDAPRPDFSGAGREHSRRRNEKYRVLRALEGKGRRPRTIHGGETSALFAGVATRIGATIG